MTKIKICGLFREIDIEYANEILPDYVGFIINFDKSHRNINHDLVVNFTKKLDKNIKTVGVFVDENIDNILRISKYLDVIQLHGNENEDFVSDLKKFFSDKNIPEKEIWKAFKIKSESDFQNALNFKTDRILLDNGYGTGEVFDWNILDKSKINRNFILAGGINSNNVITAIEKFNPEILDISSSVETDKKKDLDKMREIVNIIRKGEKNE